MAQRTRGLAVVAFWLAAALALAACSASGGSSSAAEPPSTTAAPTTAAPTTVAPTTAAPTTAAPTTAAPTTEPPTTTKPKPTKPAEPPKLSSGSEGRAVEALQRRLAELGYQVHEVDGQFGSETHHAVVAFQKVNRLGRDGVVGPVTRKALERPRVPSPRSRKAGFHVEADLTLQVIYLVKDGKIQEILDASSASGQNYTVDGDVRVAVTPLGDFQIQRKIDAWRKSDLGLLYRPAYFTGGYALHGSYSVPAFPASHGCIRITIAAMDRLFGRLPVGTPMLVYRS
ncbi:MAG TPA: L,D-transpeptidase family protein [Actinomycetota bacterium]|nr:L,D-transpeptidase family protein [Actinomycetota bacterium]